MRLCTREENDLNSFFVCKHVYAVQSNIARAYSTWTKINLIVQIEVYRLDPCKIKQPKPCNYIMAYVQHEVESARAHTAPTGPTPKL